MLACAIARLVVRTTLMQGPSLSPPIARTRCSHVPHASLRTRASSSVADSSDGSGVIKNRTTSDTRASASSPCAAPPSSAASATASPEAAAAGAGAGLAAASLLLRPWRLLPGGSITSTSSRHAMTAAARTECWGLASAA